MRVNVHQWMNGEEKKIAKIEFQKEEEEKNQHIEQPYLSNGIGRDFVDAVDEKWSQSKHTRDTCEYI